MTSGELEIQITAAKHLGQPEGARAAEGHDKTAGENIKES